MLTIKIRIIVINKKEDNTGNIEFLYLIIWLKRHVITILSSIKSSISLIYTNFAPFKQIIPEIGPGLQPINKALSSHDLFNSET